MTSLSLYAVAALLVSRMQKGGHVLVVGARADEVIGLAIDISRQDDRERLHARKDMGNTPIAPWTGHVYVTKRPDQEMTCIAGTDMDLVLILGDTVPPWGVYPYGCPVLRVHVDDRDD